MVITGGGAQLASAKELFELLTGMDVRIGHPNEYLGKSRVEAAKSPMFATAIGLVLAGFRNSYAPNREKNALANKPTKTNPAAPSEKPKAEPRPDFLRRIIDKTKIFLVDDLGDNKDY